MPRMLKKLMINFIVFDSLIIILALVYILWGNHIRELVSTHNSCFLHDVFRVYCPGCGGTRALEYLVKGHPVKSVMSNPTVVYTIYLFFHYNYIAWKSILTRDYEFYVFKSNAPALVLVAIILGNFVIRNILLCFFNIDYLGELLVYWN